MFSEKEISYCLSKADPYPHFAARFAAKEAIIKASGLKLKDLINIEVSNDKYGIPKAKIKNKKGKFLISLAHTRNQAIAIALWLN